MPTYTSFECLSKNNSSVVLGKYSASFRNITPIYICCIEKFKIMCKGIFLSTTSNIDNISSTFTYKKETSF